MFSSSPPTHPKIGCANHLHIWGKNSTWAKEEVALPSGVPIWRKGAAAVLKWRGLGGLELQLRKKAGTPPLPFSLLPSSSSFSSGAPGRRGAAWEPGSGTSRKRGLVTLPAPRPHLAEHTMQVLRKNLGNEEPNLSSKPCISLTILFRGLRRIPVFRECQWSL